MSHAEFQCHWIVADFIALISLLCGDSSSRIRCKHIRPTEDGFEFIENSLKLWLAREFGESVIQYSVGSNNTHLKMFRGCVTTAASYVWR